MAHEPKGNLIIIGGHEEKKGDRKILKTVASKANEYNGHLVIIAAATSAPEETLREYTKIFSDLGVKKIESLSIRSRQQAYAEENVEVAHHAGVFFFTGGDQLRITSMIGDSPLFT